MSFTAFAAERGLIINSIIPGRWVRVPTEDKPHKRNGAYWYGGEFGHCQNWGTMDSVETWQDSKPRTPYEQKELTERMAKAKAAHSRERAAAQRKAAAKASWILGQCELDRHAYLDSKGFSDATGNVWRRPDIDPLLVIPMRHNGDVCGCQLIGIDGSKKFLTGQRTNDAVFQIGNGAQTFLVEGYASGLSLQALLAALKVKSRILCTFSVGNATRIARTLPGALWIADNDESMTGQKAAEASGLKWWMPPTAEQDINDMHREMGLFGASQLLRKWLLTCAG